ncbi:MAG: NAD-dependent epimerase/dehydratase family protein [Lachnospiraceae bacterium]|nr:NAD-dependent epimerase/dehydratase family protein [Lachnospiraceae bacterium]
MLTDNELYMEDIKYVADLRLPWEKLHNAEILITGSTGLIGSFLVDLIMYRNQAYAMNCRIFAIGRDEARAKRRFAYCYGDSNFSFLSHDVQRPLRLPESEKITYVLHLASNTHPLQYSGDPIGTIMTNVVGTQNMLDIAAACQTKRVLLASSNEIYGENRGDVEFFDEEYCGYIDSNTLRAGYPESKRCAEALCQAYIRSKGVDAVVARLTRTYGPTMLTTDSKALSQFLKKGISGEDVVLKSNGEQFYSYCYVSDAVSGLLSVLLLGRKGMAYNIADEKSDIRLKELAGLIAEYNGKNVIYELPDKTEAAGYSTAVKARLNGKLLKQLGWEMRYDIKAGVRRTLDILGRENGTKQKRCCY